MRKRKKGRKFGRERAQRKALLKSIANALFIYGKIKTTESKAKEAKMTIEKMITTAKRGGLVNKRLLAKELSPKVVKKLIDEIAPQYKERKGGYLRIVKLGQRSRDSAPMAILQLVK